MPVEKPLAWLASEVGGVKPGQGRAKAKATAEGGLWVEQSGDLV